jgi:FKBP-type peptidyl-prolyl cis-trans isomerase
MSNKLIANIILVFFVFTSCNRSKQNYTNKPTNDNQEKLIEVNRVLVKKDRQKIIGFIKRKGWNMSESDVGLWYEILDSGDGDSAKTGMVANFEYKISLLDGTVCYDSHTDGRKSFLIGKGNVETGLEYGILYLREGSKARFIFPPYLAHGLPGDGERIPARAILIYEVELISLTNPD